MLRTLDVVLIAVMIAAAAFTYRVKHQAEEQVRAIRHLKAQIQLEKNTIDLLKADWSVLTQPARLQKLIAVYQSELNLQTIQPTQVATLNDLPDYPKPAAPPVPTASPEAPPAPPAVARAKPLMDMTATGSVVR
ncbi:MAG TPA: hypothetical protein VFJ18_14375 [Pararhizobium sp.]|nr:hypothetical protein [Pararhizobium sp.]